MIFPIKNVEDLQKLNELNSLETQVKAKSLQDKLGEQIFHGNIEKAFEPITKAIKHVSEEVTKTIIENSNNNNKPIENLNEKSLKLMNDEGLVTPYLASSLVNLFEPENKSQFRLIKDLNSTKMNVFF